MKYKAGSRRRAVEYEKALVEWWKKNKTFERSVEQRPIDQSYVFYDGPPFITGMPHHGTLLSSIVKDAVPRYWTMRGKRVERRWGWDCHGLPAENFVEKQLGITDRREIGTKWSLEDYILKARESMVANSETWEGTIERIGRWVNFRGAYRTMDKDFMESVWWAFKTLYEKGKIYEGRKVLMYDTKFATPVSKSEVTMDNDAYQTVTDPSAYVRFKLTAQVQPVYLLAWTTTPWTLPANLALAVKPELEYAAVRVSGEEGVMILAASLLEKVLKGAEYEVVRTGIKGAELAGLEYEPLFKNLEQVEPESYHVLAAEFVSDTEGTGIVHIAPAYGEDDYALAQGHQVGFADVLDENGYYLPEMAEQLHQLGVRDTDEHGTQVWAANKFIAKCLEEAGVVWKIEYIQHEYPFNPRSKQRIIYRAFPSWFFDVQGSKPLMLEENEKINWFPGYLKHGRFAKNIEQAPDWNLSRDRFWATAMPVWKGDKGTVKVVGSYDELFELSGVRLEDYHRPWVDEIEFEIDGEHFRRIPKVLDCWFESGSMPFAQLHYPFENKEKFERNYPADFIVEYVGQVRAWFYYVHCVNTALFGRNAYKNVITTGTLAGNDGRKMSKSLGNYTDPNELMDKYSADALRFLLLSSPVLSGEDFALTDKDVSDVQRKLAMIWNVYDFFVTYAEVDNWEAPAGAAENLFSSEPAGQHFASSRGPLRSRPSLRGSLASASPVGSHVLAKTQSAGDPQRADSSADTAQAQPVYLLAWTTTPWTLPANLALAVKPELEYAAVRVSGEEGVMILAASLLEKVLKGAEYEVVRTGIKGAELAGLEYEPLFKNLEQVEPESYHVLAAEFVSDTEGTGIVHIAPAYGEDDYALAQGHQVGFADVLDENGYYLPEMAEQLHQLGVRDTDEHGTQVWAANKFIAKCLEEAGVVWKIEYIQHEYPFNPRSKQRIIYRAFPSWFFDVQGSKPLMLEENEKINWFPGYLKHGRFAKNIEQAPDWNLSRDRFWATAMPVWKGDKGTVKVVGSYDELFELSGVRLEDYHRPWVDEIEFEIDGEHFRRIPKVLDCWFESGSMPFAQLHYPFENKEKFERNYPADFIVEYVGQVRAWFYYVHCVNTALFGRNAYKNVITTGTLAGNDGRKMSKSLGNYTDPNELMDKYSADALRFLLLSSPVLSGEDFALTDKDVSDVQRKLAMIWNVYDFFVTYAEVDNWEAPAGAAENLFSSEPAGQHFASSRGPLRSRPSLRGSLASASPVGSHVLTNTRSAGGKHRSAVRLSRSTLLGRRIP